MSLTVLGVVAFFLRAGAIDFGAGALTARPDEELVRAAAWHALTGDLNPHYAVWGHLFHWVYVFAGALLVAVQVAFGLVDSWWDGVARALDDGSAHFLLGRWLSAVFGTANVVAACRLAEATTGSRLVGMLAAILLCFTFLHVRDAHFATCDILLTLLCTWVLTTGVRGGIWASGLLSGLALATKLSAAPAVAAVLCALGVRYRRKGWAAVARRAIAYLLIAGLTWALVQPFLWIDLPQTRFGLFGDLFNPERRPLRTGLHLRNLVLIGRYYVPQSMGWLMAALAAVGGAYVCFRRPRRPGSVALVAYVFLTLFVLSSVERIFLRYLDPLLPAVAVLGAIGCVTLARAFVPSRLRRRGILVGAIALAGIASVDGAWRSWHLLRLFGTPDTRAHARVWLERQTLLRGRPVRVLWCGFGQIAAHLTAPWVRPEHGYLEELLQRWRDRGEPHQLLEAVARHWSGSGVPVRLIAWDYADRADCGAVLGWVAYRGPEVRTDLPPPLDRWHAFWKRFGLLRRFQPRLFVVRCSITANMKCRDPILADPRDWDYLAVTFVPWDDDGRKRAYAYARRFRLVARFEPGGSAAEAEYDKGDAWWVPNRGLDRVQRPGPWIWIFEPAPAATGGVNRGLRSGPSVLHAQHRKNESANHADAAVASRLTSTALEATGAKRTDRALRSKMPGAEPGFQRSPSGRPW